MRYHVVVLYCAQTTSMYYNDDVLYLLLVEDVDAAVPSNRQSKKETHSNDDNW